MPAKPEHMTHLHGDTLVPKSHPRILFRGKLDSLQAQVVLIQCDLEAAGADPVLLADLQEVLELLRALMRSEVLDEPLVWDTLFGLCFDELHAQSHNPQAYFSVRAMTPPDAALGRTYALLNVLRTTVREAELAAVTAFGTERPDLRLALNRLSSAVYVLMCRTLEASL